jgi:Ca-activated chloride channel homolog
MKKGYLVILLFPLQAAAQADRGFMSKGNDYYLQLKFDLAEGQYRQAVNVAPRNTEARYNLANALMQQKKFKEAAELYTEVATSENKELRASAWYNAGVSYSKQKDLPNSIEAYKSALRLNPADKEARENLQKALQEQKQQQDQQNKQNKGGGGGLSQNQADQKLKQLEQKEKELQQRMQAAGKGKGTGGSKDW